MHHHTLRHTCRRIAALFSLALCLLMLAGITVVRGAPPGSPLATDGLPASLDWRDHGGNFCSPVGDQWDCDASSAFAAVSALESRYCIAANTPGQFVDLSEQIVISCDPNRQGCSGGSPESAAEFLRAHGAPLETCLPFAAADVDCSQACPNWTTRAFRIQGYAPISQTVDALKTALQDGPFSVSMNRYADLQYATDAVYEYQNGALIGQHSVLLVGYLDTPAQYGGGYFIAKNNWGASWGDAGYLRIAYSQVTGAVAFGQHALAYTVTLPSGDAYEPDDTRGEAKSLTAGVAQARSLQPAYDEDWARFTLLSRSDVVVETTGQQTGTQLWLYGEDASPLAHDAGAIDRHGRLAATLEPGIYDVRVAASSPGDAFAAYTLTLTADDWLYTSAELWLNAYGTSAGWTSQNTHPRTLADVNGDGKADVVGFGRAGVYVSLSTGAGFAQPALWAKNFGIAAGGWTSQDKYPRQAADVNGDRKADIIGCGSKATNVALSTGKSFGTAKAWNNSYHTGAGWTSQNTYPRFVADVSGDGKADLVGFGRNGVSVSTSTGSSFRPAALWLASFGVSAGGWTKQDLYPRLLADVNGDRKADVLGFGKGGVIVARSTGSGLAKASLWLADFGASAGWSSQNAYPRAAADLDGDRRADAIGFYADGVRVSSSTGSAFAAAVLRKHDLGTDQGWTSYDAYPRMAADVNGDGKADLVGFGADGVYVALAP